MAFKRTKQFLGYGPGGTLRDVAPNPICSQRAPTTADLAQIGSVWVDEPNNAWYVLTSVVANSASWVGQSSGTGTFASLTVTGNSDLQTNVTVGGTLGVTGATTLGDTNIVGDFTLTGDFDITDTAAISLTSTFNGVEAIYLHANGGALEQIRIHSDQGTSVNSVELDSDAGGITLVAGLASDDAINLSATGGGVDIDGILQVNIASSENAADAIVINASAGGMDLTAAGAAGEDIDITNTAGSVNITAGESAADSIVISSTNGGIDIISAGASAGEDIDITATGSSVNVTSTEDTARAIYLHANAGTSETIQLHADQGTGAGSIELLSDVGGVTLTATGLASADAINFSAPAGGIDMDGALEINIASSQAAATAISMDASNAAGGITMAAGTGGILVGNQADCTTIDVGDVAPTASRTITVGGGTVVTAAVTDTIDIGVDGATTNADSIKVVNVATGVVTTGQNNVNINTGTAASGSQTTNIGTGTGGAATKIVNIGNADGLTSFTLSGTSLINDSVNVNTSINTGTSTGAVEIGNSAAGAITIIGSANSSFTASGVGVDLTLDSPAGRVIINGEEAAANAITLLSAAGGIDADAALQVNIASSQNAADAIRLSASAGGIDIDATGSSGEDIDILNTGGSVSISATESAADAIVLDATAGGINILASGAAAGEDIDITATGSSVNVTSTENTAQAIYLHANGGTSEGIDIHSDQGTGDTSVNIHSDAGGITLNSGTGAVLMTPQTASFAGTTVTINARVGVATFTGQTTAAGANVDLTITNSEVTQGQGVFCTVSNIGSNDADITLEGCITETAGTLLLRCQNNGAAALNGDIIVTFWLIN